MHKNKIYLLFSYQFMWYWVLRVVMTKQSEPTTTKNKKTKAKEKSLFHTHKNTQFSHSTNCLAYCRCSLLRIEHSFAQQEYFIKYILFWLVGWWVYEFQLFFFLRILMSSSWKRRQKTTNEFSRISMHRRQTIHYDTHITHVFSSILIYMSTDCFIISCSWSRFHFALGAQI